MAYKNPADAKQYHHDWYEKNKAREKAKRQTWKHTHQEMRRAREIERDYHISAQEYDARLAAQNGLCALCRRPFDATRSGKPVLDHNHLTGELRDFLHAACNLGLGNFQDDAVRCRLAAEYLEKHNARQ